MMYKSSKGPVAIDTMPLRYASNALAKLRREAPERTAEIDALAAHCAKLEADQDENPRAVIGGNNPPEETPEASGVPKWDAVKIHMDDLLTEAANWADGVEIVNQDQADTVGKLKQDLTDAANLADTARVAEKKPLDDQIAEIQDRYNAYIAPMKNKVPGSVSKAVTALNNMLSVWLRKLDDEKREREAEAAAVAAAAAAEALAARAEAKTSGDIAVMDRAEDKLAEAEALIREAKGVAAEKVQVQGGRRAISLRSYWIAEMVEKGGAAAINHYLKVKPDRIKDFIQSLADEDVRNGVRSIPGFIIREEKRV